VKTALGPLVGINDISLYLPSPRIDIASVVERRVFDNPRLDRHMERACRTTGQRAIRFPEPWEDSATMAAQAGLGLLSRVDASGRGGIRHLAVGTETGVDHSKPISAYVQGMLERAGAGLPRSASSFQVQHACAGGTMALLGTAALLYAGGREGESGLVLSTDIARYESESTAEITQGAGAVAMQVSLSPRLLELDLSSVGYWSMDVDDFFRPLGSTVAQVKGSYSMKCYWDSLEGAFRDHCRQTGTEPERALAEADLFALHTPFRNMPESAMVRLLERIMGFGADRAHAFLQERGFSAGVDPMADIGNIYSASLWAVLAFLLEERYRELGSAIVGKRVLLASYGSGSTMVVISGRVAASAPEVISRWELGRLMGSARTAGFDEYSAWLAGAGDAEEHERMIDQAALPAGAFFLAGIRKDGYREYRKAEELGDWIKEREASRDLHRSLAVQY
jgi:hydroxymethylglutaryl-CoA synthase